MSKEILTLSLLISIICQRVSTWDFKCLSLVERFHFIQINVKHALLLLLLPGPNAMSLITHYCIEWMLNSVRPTTIWKINYKTCIYQLNASNWLVGKYTGQVSKSSNMKINFTTSLIWWMFNFFVIHQPIVNLLGM